MTSKNPSTSRNKNRKNRRRNVSMLSTSKSKDALNGDRNFPYSLISNGTKNIKRINESPVFALTQGTRNDMEYCKEMSRKAIARAGLYLGVTSMDKDALGVLGDTLVDYLEKVGIFFVTLLLLISRTHTLPRLHNSLQLYTMIKRLDSTLRNQFKHLIVRLHTAMFSMLFMLLKHVLHQLYISLL